MSEQTNTEPEGFGLPETERRAGYQPMPLVNPLPEPDLSEVEDTGVSARDAADALAERRRNEQQPLPPLEREAIERQYNRHDTGEKMADHLVVSKEQASADLSAVRGAEDEAKLAQVEADLIRQLDAEAGLAQQQQPPPQTEVPPQEVPVQEQPQPQEQPAQQWSKAWEDPEVIATITEYNQQINGAVQNLQQQFINELATTAGQATAAIFGVKYPELAGLQTIEQLQGAIAAISQQNPERGQQAINDIKTVTQLSQKAQEVQQQQTRAYQQQHRQAFDHVAKMADDAYDNWIEQQEPDADRRHEISTTAKQMLREPGLSDQEMSYHWSTNPILRSFAGQQILADAARYRMSRQGVQTKRANPVPTVTRPGSPAERGSEADYNVRQLSDKLSKSTGREALEAAAALVSAKRARR